MQGKAFAPHTVFTEKTEENEHRWATSRGNQSPSGALPRRPTAGLLRGKQGCVAFRRWVQWGSGACWHAQECHHSKLFSQHRLVQLCPSLHFLRLP